MSKPMQDKEAGPEPGDMPQGEPENCMATRQSARGVLGDLINRHKDMARGLEVLSKSLPMELSREADEALWRLLVSVRNS